MFADPLMHTHTCTSSYTHTCTRTHTYTHTALLPMPVYSNVAYITHGYALVMCEYVFYSISGLEHVNSRTQARTKHTHTHARTYPPTHPPTHEHIMLRPMHFVAHKRSAHTSDLHTREPMKMYANERIIPYIWGRHVTHMNESCHSSTGTSGVVCAV